jgi:molybdate transport system substrate-binding protein
MKSFAVLLVATFLTSLHASAEPMRVTVFAAASMGNILTDVVAEYDGDVALSLGGSGVMARQVAAGAPADLIVLANSDWMAWLVGKRPRLVNSSIVIASNRLTVIGPPNSAPLAPENLVERLSGNRLAMGQRDGVPAGNYARAWLQSAGLWDAVEPALAETDNVRAALALVARGEAPLGIVYATDAQAEPGVAVVYSVPSNLHPEIVYPAAAITSEGEDFLNFLTSDTATHIFARHGFGPGTQ